MSSQEDPQSSLYINLQEQPKFFMFKVDEEMLHQVCEKIWCPVMSAEYTTRDNPKIIESIKDKIHK